MQKTRWVKSCDHVHTGHAVNIVLSWIGKIQCIAHYTSLSHSFHLQTVSCFTTRDVWTEIYISLPGLLDVGCRSLLATWLGFSES